jgi:hypothetical protein
MEAILRPMRYSSLEYDERRYSNVLDVKSSWNQIKRWSITNASSSLHQLTEQKGGPLSFRQKTGVHHRLRYAQIDREYIGASVSERVN